MRKSLRMVRSMMIEERIVKLLMKKGEDEGGIVFMVGVCAYAAIK